jgi:hypothetical protein
MNLEFRARRPAACHGWRPGLRLRRSGLARGDCPWKRLGTTPPTWSQHARTDYICHRAWAGLPAAESGPRGGADSDSRLARAGGLAGVTAAPDRDLNGTSRWHSDRHGLARRQAEPLIHPRLSLGPDDDQSHHNVGPRHLGARAAHGQSRDSELGFGLAPNLLGLRLHWASQVATEAGLRLGSELEACHWQ